MEGLHGLRESLSELKGALVNFGAGHWGWRSSLEEKQLRIPTCSSTGSSSVGTPGTRGKNTCSTPTTWDRDLPRKLEHIWGC